MDEVEAKGNSPKVRHTPWICGMATANAPRWNLAFAPAILIAAIAALVCSLVFHGGELSNFVLSIDEEFGIGRFNRANYIENGRWGMALLSWLVLPQNSFPITALGIFLAAYSMAFVLIISRFKIQKWEPILISAPLFFGFPTLLYLLAFNTINFAIGIGLLASTASLYIQPRRRNIVIAATVVAFAVSTYQSVLFFIIVLFIADCARRITLNRQSEEIKSLGKWYTSVIVSGLVIYATISLAVLWLFKTKPDYLQIYFHPELDPVVVLKTTITSMWRLYTGAASCFLDQAFYYPLLVGVVAAGLCWQIIAMARRSRRVAFVLAVCLTAIVVAPFLQYPTSGGWMPYRVLVGLPAAVFVLALIAADGSPKWLRRWILIPLAVLVTIEFSAINNRQYYAGHWALERDKAIAMQIVFQIQQMLPKQKDYTVTLVGALPPYHDSMVPSVPGSNSTIGASFFNWDEGNVYRVVAFLGIVSGMKFKAASLDQSEKAMSLAAAMPSWPLQGSVAQLNDVVIIKLSEPTDMQINDLCRESTSQFCTAYRRSIP